MSLLSRLQPLTKQVFPGIFQTRIQATYESLTVSDFEADALRLPETLERAVHKRQIEFLLGRYCVQQCFHAFNVEPIFIPIHQDRSPIWPSAWIGSVSHSKGQVVAVLANRCEYVGLGIDLEAYITAPSAGLRAQICIDSNEIEDLQAAMNLTEDEALTLIFSGKESLYKLVHPRYKNFFGFQAARVRASKSGVEGLEIELTQQLSDEFPRHRTWPLRWQRLTPDTLETFLIEPAL